MGLQFLILLSALFWMRIRGMCNLPDGKDWLWGQLGLALMGRAVLSKTLIQMSADGWDCALSLLVVWPETRSPGVNKFQEGSCHSAAPRTALSVHLSLWEATADPQLCRRPSVTHRQVWLSLLWGHCSCPLGPGVHKILFVPSKSLCYP